MVCSDLSCLQGALTPESLSQLREQSLLEHLQLDTGVSPAGQFATSTVSPCVLLRDGSETAPRPLTGVLSLCRTAVSLQPVLIS